MGVDLTAPLEKWDTVRRYIADKALTSKFDKNTLAQALVEAIAQYDTIHRRVRAQQVQISGLQNDVQNAEVHFRDWIGNRMDEMDKLSYDVEALIAVPTQQDTNGTVQQDSEYASRVNKELSSNAVTLEKELAAFAAHASDADTLHNVLLTQLMSAIKNMRGFHTESLQARETLQVRESELHEAKQDIEALKLTAGGQVIQQTMAADMCQFEDAVNEILFEKEMRSQGMKSALTTAERKVAKLELQLKRTQNEANMLQEQLTTIRLGRGTIEEDGMQKESSKELHECRISLEETKQQLSQANSDIASLTQESKRSEDVESWIKEQAESRSNSEAGIEKLISGIQAAEEKKMSDTLVALRKDHTAQMKQMQKQCKQSFETQAAAEDSLLAMKKMSDRGSLVAEVQGTRKSNESLIQVTAKLGVMMQQKEKVLAQRESEVAVATQRIKELEEQIESVPNKVDAAPLQSPPPAETTVQVNLSTECKDASVYSDRLSRELEQMKKEKHLAVADLEAELKHVKDLKLNRVSELESQLQEVLKQSESLKVDSNTRVQEACQKLQSLVDEKEMEIAVLDALSKKYKSQLEEQISTTGSAQNDEALKAMEQEINNLQNQLAEMELVISEQENDILAVEGERDDVLSQSINLADEVSRLQSSMQRMENKMAGLAVPELRAQVAELQEENSALQISLVECHVTKEEHLRVVIEKDEEMKQAKAAAQQATERYTNVIEALQTDNEAALARIKIEDSQIIAKIENETTRAMQALEAQVEICEIEKQDLKDQHQNNLKQMLEQQKVALQDYVEEHGKKQRVLEEQQAAVASRAEVLEAEALTFKDELERSTIAHRQEFMQALHADVKVIHKEGEHAREIFRLSSESEKKALERRLEKVLGEEAAKRTGREKEHSSGRMCRILFNVTLQGMQSAIKNMKLNLMDATNTELQTQMEQAAAAHQAEILALANAEAEKLAQKDEEHAQLQQYLDKERKSFDVRMQSQIDKVEMVKAESIKTIKEVKVQHQSQLVSFQQEIESLSQENTTAQEELGHQKQLGLDNEEELLQLRAVKEIVALVKTAEDDANSDVVGELSSRIGKLTLERDRLEKLSAFKETEIEAMQVSVEKFADEADTLQDENDLLATESNTLRDQIQALSDQKAALETMAVEQEKGFKLAKVEVEAIEQYKSLLISVIDPNAEPTAQITDAATGSETGTPVDAATSELTLAQSMTDLIAMVSEKYKSMEVQKVTLEQESKTLKAKLKANNLTCPSPPQNHTFKSSNSQTKQEMHEPERTVSSNSEPGIEPEKSFIHTQVVEPEAGVSYNTLIDQALAGRPDVSIRDVVPQFSEQLNEALTDEKLVQMAPQCRIGAFKSLVEQLQICKSGSNLIEGTVLERKQELDTLQAALLQNDPDPNITTLITSFQGAKQGDTQSEDMWKLFKPPDAVESMKIEFEETIKQVEEASERARTTAERQQSRANKLSTQLKALGEKHILLEQSHNELKAEINVTPGKQGELLQNHNDLQEKCQDLHKTIEEQQLKYQELESQHQISSDEKEKLSAQNDRLSQIHKEFAVTDARRWAEMFRCLTSLRGQTNVKIMQSEALSTLEGRIRDLKAGPATIPRKLELLVTWLQKANQVGLARKLVPLEEVYVKASESKKALDATIHNVVHTHSHTLKHLHFGLNWIKIDAYDVLEDAMIKMECSPEVSYFDDLVKRVAAELAQQGLAETDTLIGRIQEIESAVKRKRDLTSKGKMSTNDQERANTSGDNATAVHKIVSAALSSESGVRRDILDHLQNRIELLQETRHALSGEEIAFRLEDVGMKSQSQAFRQMLDGSSCHQTNLQEWLSGMQVIESAAQSLEQLETSIDTRACKIGGAYLLNQWMTNLKTPPTQNAEAAKIGGVVEILQQAGANDEATAFEKCLQSAQLLQDGKLAKSDFELAHIEFCNLLKNVQNLPVLSSAHEFDLPKMLSEHILEFKSNSPLALSEREQRHQEVIFGLNLQIDDLRTKEVEAARVQDMLSKMQDTCKKQEGELKQKEGTIQTLEHAKAESQSETERIRALYAEYKGFEETKQHNTALVQEVEKLKMEVEKAPVVEQREENPDHGAVHDAYAPIGDDNDDFFKAIAAKAFADFETTLQEVLNREKEAKLELEAISIELEEQTSMGAILTQTLRHLEYQLIDSESNTACLRDTVQKLQLENNAKDMFCSLHSTSTKMEQPGKNEAVEAMQSQIADAQVANTSERVFLRQEVHSMRKKLHHARVTHRCEKMALQKEATDATEKLCIYQNSLMQRISLLEDELEEVLRSAGTMATLANMDRSLYDESLLVLSDKLEAAEAARADQVAKLEEAMQDLRTRRNKNEATTVVAHQRAIEDLVEEHKRSQMALASEANHEKAKVYAHLELLERQITDVSESAEAALLASSQYKTELTNLTKVRDAERAVELSFRETVEEEMLRLTKVAEDSLEATIAMANSIESREAVAAQAVNEKEQDTKRIEDLEARLKNGQCEMVRLVSSVVHRATHEHKTLTSKLHYAESQLQVKSEAYNSMFGELASCKVVIAKKQAQIVKLSDLNDEIEWKETVANKLRQEQAVLRAATNDLEVELGQAKLEIQKRVAVASAPPTAPPTGRSQIQQATTGTNVEVPTIAPDEDQGGLDMEVDLDRFDFAQFGESPRLSDVEEDFDWSLSVEALDL